MHEDLLPLIRDLEAAVEAGNCQTAVTVLDRLNEVDIYSGNEVYDRLHAIDGKLAVMLFEGLTPTEFGRIVGSHKHLYSFNVWEALESVADRVNANALWAIKDYMGFPAPRLYPKLHAVLAEASDEKITEHLIHTIDRLSQHESTAGHSLSAHERTMSAFRYIRWGPDDKGLGDHLRLLGARGDESAVAACALYITQLPWGLDRSATVELLEGMSTKRAAENLSLFRKALVAHREPAVLRTWLWGAIGEADPRECLLGTISDLACANDDADRITYIEFLGGVMEQVCKERHSWTRELVAAAERVNTKKWPRVLRGLYGTMLYVQLPEADKGRVSSRFDRAMIYVAGAWEAVRLDHMGCLIPLALMIGAGWLTSFGLNCLVGEPKRAPWLPVALFWSWVAWALSTIRTHFSGHETINKKVVAGFVYFALLLAAIFTAIIVRLI